MAEIKLEHVACAYGATNVLHDIDLTIEDGQLHTLLGPSGCGKTTMLRLVAGFLFPSKGRILIDGKDVSTLSPEKRHMGIVFQNYALFPHMNVGDNVGYGLKIAHTDKAKIRSRVAECLEMVGLGAYAKRNIADLSGGQQQRVAIARALAFSPRVLLLDEPMSNLDVSLRASLRDEIRAIQRAVGITTLFITHDQQEALSISDTVSVMHEGCIVQTGAPTEVYEHPADDFAADFVGTTNRIGGRSFRPEQLRLASAQGPGAAALAQGCVDRVRYLGSVVEYLVDCEGAIVTVMALNNTGSYRPQEGDDVRIEEIR